MKIVSELDYVILYAEKLKKNNKFFNQQKELIESQIEASSSLFKNAFGQDFKANARKYLRGIGLIE